MPNHRHPDERGDLIINYKVAFPDKISKKNNDLLINLLPGKSEPFIPEDAIYKTLVPINPESVFQQPTTAQEEHGAQSMRCATQ